MNSSTARLIDVDVVDAAVKNVIDMIKREAEVEIVYNSDELRGAITLSLKQRTVDFALQVICDQKGLKFYKKDGVYFIAKSAPAASPETSRNDPPMPEGPSAISRRPTEHPLPSVPERTRNAGSLVPGTADDLLPIPRIDTAPKVAAEKMSWSKITLRYLSASMIGHMFNPDIPDRSPYAIMSGVAANGMPGADYLRQLGLTPGRSPLEELTGPQLRDQIGTGGLYRSNRSQLIGPGGGEASSGFRGLGGGGLGGGGLGGGGLGGGGLGGGGLGGGGLGGAGGGGSIPRPTGIESILAFDPLNALIVRGTESAIAELQELINLLDRPLKQVLIEAQFVTVSTSVSDSFAVNWQLQQGPFNIAVQFPAGGDVQVGYVRGNFRAQLGLLEAQNKAKTVQSPRVIALNNALAFITSFETRFIVVQTAVANIGGQGQQSRIPIPITIPISLSAIPTIHDDGTVTVAISPTVVTSNIVNQDGVTLPNTTTATTLVNVTLRDGDTVVVGGLVQNSRTAASSRMPFLANLPLIGSLFRTRNNIQDESELLIFVTVHLLPNAQEDTGTSTGRPGGGL